MKIKHHTAFQAGYALVTVLLFAGISIVILASTLNWTSGSSRITERNNSYNRTVSAAEAGVESVIARMDRDFLNRSLDYNNLTDYRLTVPTTYMPTGWPLDYQFTDTNGVVDHTTVIGGGVTVQTNIDPQLPGLYGMVFPCRIASCAKRLGTPGYNVAAGVQQDFLLVGIPIFQFEAFYSLDLEINPGPQMYITGKVHGNANMFLAPQTGLEFFDAVEAVGKIYLDRMTNDPAYGSGKVSPVFDSTHQGGANSMTLPIGTNNSPSEVVKVLDVPPAGEDPLSPLGAARFYNQTDLIITTFPPNAAFPNGYVSVMSGLWDLNTPVKGDVTNGVYSFITTTNTFYDGRENKWAQVTDLDIGLFNQWLTNTTGGAALNLAKKTKYGTNATPVGLNSIYINDMRPGTATSFAAVRGSDGRYLPPDGLTVATARPIYVKGDYNAPILGSADTSTTKPAALIGDAISVLSSGWLDGLASNSGQSPTRPAQDDTVNAAFMAGIVETTRVGNVPHYSGGLENFPRFLENWSGKNFTYNGSMVVMFPSRFATSWWVGPSATTYYQAPKRIWAFDKNYLALQKLPPCTPQVRKLVRGQWTTIAAAAP